MSADAPTPLADAAPKAAYRDAMFCELVSADFARDLERRLNATAARAQMAETDASLTADQNRLLHSTLAERCAERDAAIARAEHAEAEWQAQAALVKASVEREAIQSRVALEYADERDSFAKLVVVLREALEHDERYLILIRDYAAEVANNAPEEKERFKGRQIIIVSSKALESHNKLPTTPALASVSFAKLREEVSKLTEVDFSNAAIIDKLQAERDALAAQVAMMREALCEADQMLQMTVGVFGGIPKDGSPAAKIAAALQSTPATASAELVALRAKVRKLADHLEQMLNVAENADETGYVADCGFIDLDKLHAKVRTAIDAARQTPTDAAMEAKP